MTDWEGDGPAMPENPYEEAYRASLDISASVARLVYLQIRLEEKALARSVSRFIWSVAAKELDLISVVCAEDHSPFDIRVCLDEILTRYINNRCANTQSVAATHRHNERESP